MKALEEVFQEVLESHGIVARDLSKPAVRFVEANGLRFRVLDWGGSGSPILFLHGGGQDSYTWELVCLQLREKYHCYALDLRNHGESDQAPTPNGPHDMAEDVNGVVAALKLRDFVLVGMSMGGLTSMAYVAKYQGTKACVLVDITPTVTRERRQETYAYNARNEFDSFEEAEEEAAKVNPHRPRVHLEFTLRHMLTENPDGKWVRKRARTQGPPPAPSGASGAPTRPPGTFEDLWSVVSQISCPTLVVHGEASNATDYGDAQRLAAFSLMGA